MVDAKVRIVEADGGSRGGGLVRCLPLTPSAVMNTTRTGTQAKRSYLRNTLVIADHIQQEWKLYQVKTL
jgi:hypothetical protein